MTQSEKLSQLSLGTHEREKLLGHHPKIVFSSDRDVDYEIYIMNADGTEQIRPIWTPQVTPTSDASPYYNKGLEHWDKGNWSMAIEQFTIALRADPKDVGATYSSRGHAYMVLGELELAIQDFGDVIQLDLNDVRAYYWRGWIYGLIDQHANADADKAKACFLDNLYC